jgi:hypothetical protein
VEKVQVFQPEDDGTPEHYRSHPTDYMREQNAKRFYIRSPQDDRSPWLLFGRLAELRTEVTGRFYEHALGRKEDYNPQPAAEVQQFIDAEHAETTYDPKYHGLYDGRFIDPGELKELPAASWPTEQLASWFSSWPSADLEQQVKAYNERQSEFGLLRGLQSGELSIKGKTFPFRDRQCTILDVDGLLKQVDKELDGDLEAFHRLDREAFLARWSLARHLDGGQGNGREHELLQRYRFHMDLQGLLKGMFAEQGRLRAILGMLSNNTQLSEADFKQVRDMLREINNTIENNLEAAKSFATPSLTNVPAGSSLRTLIADRGDTTELPWLGEDSITGEWLGKLMARLEGVLGRTKRVHFKSLGSLLAYQEKLAGEWQSTCSEQTPATAASTNN